MKCIAVRYDEETRKIHIDEKERQETWPAVCRRFNDDVHRLRDVDEGDYTGLYECFDEDNKRFYYLVEEDAALNRIKHKTFLKKLGKT